MSSHKNSSVGLSSSEAARYLGVSLSQLRKLEAQGLLTPYRTKGGHRRFSIEVLSAVQIPQPGKTSTATERYSRQYLVDGWNQAKLSRARVMIVGAGALGCVVGPGLAMAGVGELIVVDMDTVEISNLSRQLLFRDYHLGGSKAAHAAAMLQSMNPDIVVRAIDSRIQDVPRKEFRNLTVLVDSLDNFDTRRWLNGLAIGEKIPLVSGGMFGFWGNLQVVIPEKTPCLECQLLLPAHRLQKACTPIGSRREIVQDEPEEKVPSVSSISFVIGGLMTQECFKIILQMEDSVLKDYLFWDGLSESFTRMPILKNETCVVCSSRYKLNGIPMVGSAEEPLEDFLSRVYLTLGLLRVPSSLEIVVKTQRIDQDSSLLLGDAIQSGDLMYLFSDDLPKAVKIRVSL
ncbi:MAG: ThiF family adenylyltransferase [Candidatus Heimdallarchaeota archaeon]